MEGQLHSNFKKLHFRRDFQLLFSPIPQKYRELEPACQTVGKNLTPYDTTNAPYNLRCISKLSGRDERRIRQ